MDAYTFKADLLCEDCAQHARLQLADDGKADTGDSEDWPQGPLADGGGLADVPNHCGQGEQCRDALTIEASGLKVGRFLENPLTPDGWTWLRDRLSEANKDAHSRKVCTLWREHYGLGEAENWPTLRFSAIWSNALADALGDRLRGLRGSYEGRGFESGYEMAAHDGTDDDTLCESFAHEPAGVGAIEAAGRDGNGRQKRRFTHEGLIAFVRFLMDEIDPDNDPILDRAPSGAENWHHAAHSLASAICATLAIELV